jgi:hypothetical protein
MTKTESSENAPGEFHSESTRRHRPRGTIPARVAFSRFQIVTSAVFFNRPMHGIPKSALLTKPPVFNTVNGLAAGRVHRTHGRVSIRRVQVTMWVAGFTHGSAHRNPPRLILNIAQVELPRGMRKKSPHRLSVYRFPYDISLCIHQDMAPQTSSTPVDT